MGDNNTQPSIQEVAQDPDFLKLPDSEKLKVLNAIDPDFKNLPPVEKEKAVKFFAPKPPPVEDETSGGFLGTMAEETDKLIDKIPQGHKEKLSSIYTPLLEASAATGGYMATGPGLPTPTNIAGGTLGYMMGRSAARGLDELIGLSDPLSLEETLRATGEDARTGLTFELGGHAVAPTFQAAKIGGRWVLQRMGPAEYKELLKNAGANATGKAAEEILAAHTSKGTVYAKNAEEAAEIEAQIPGLKFSRAERTNDPELIKLQRAQERGGGAADLKKNLEADNVTALRDYYKGEFGGKENIDDVQRLMADQKTKLQTVESKASKTATAKTPNAVYPQDTGTELLESINTAKAPIKKGMSALEKEIPDYPMQFKNLREKITELKADKKLSLEKKRALLDFENDLNKILENSSESTHTGMGIRRTLNDQITKYHNAKEGYKESLLIKLKNSLEADFSAVSAKTKSGEIAEYKGRAVDPGNIASKVESDSKRLAELSGSQKPDVDLMKKELNDVGYPTMRVVQEGEKAYAERIAKSYQNKFGKEPPLTTDKYQEKMVAELKSRIANNKEILSKASPGQDVAASLRAYNDFASTKYFARFDTKAINLASKNKNQISTIPKYFTTSDGADDLIRAVGQNEAAGIMKGHYAYEMLNKATNPSTGEIIEKSLSKWYKNNWAVLKKYGLSGYFADIVKANKIADATRLAVRDFEKSTAQKLLDADPDKAVASIIKGANTAKATRELLEKIGDNKAARNGLKNAFADHIVESARTTAETIKNDPKTSIAKLTNLMNKYEPAIQVLYKGEPQKINALRNIQKAYKIMARSASSPLGGGSDTGEIVATLLQKTFGSMSMVSRTAQAINVITSVLTHLPRKKANEMVNRLLFDPDAAYAVNTILKGRGGIDKEQTDVIINAINNKVINLENYKKGLAAQAAAAAGLVVNSGKSD
jgi:nicotinamide riboside kinase